MAITKLMAMAMLDEKKEELRQLCNAAEMDAGLNSMAFEDAIAQVCDVVIRLELTLRYDHGMKATRH